MSHQFPARSHRQFLDSDVYLWTSPHIIVTVGPEIVCTNGPRISLCSDTGDGVGVTALINIWM